MVQVIKTKYRTGKKDLRGERRRGRSEESRRKNTRASRFLFVRAICIQNQIPWTDESFVFSSIKKYSCTKSPLHLMGSVRVSSSPYFIPSAGLEQANESTIEGNVKLLLKQMQDSSREDPGSKLQCIAGMTAIVDDLKSRVQKLQDSARRGMPELRRCNTELRRGALPREPKKPHLDPAIATADDVQTLRRELFTSTNARRSLEKMFSSLGKEKEMIAAELARKVRELGEAEEVVEDLRARNEVLLEKVRVSAPASPEHKAMKESDQFVPALRERNKALSEQLLKTIDGYRVMKMRVRDVQEENARNIDRVEEATASGVRLLRRLRERLDSGGGGGSAAVEELEALERTLAGLRGSVVKDSKLRGSGPTEKIIAELR